MSFRIGYGEDIHRLRKGGRFVLGGVLISSDVSPVAHSDGDCLYHALADAILGAVGEEDIGHLFPPDDPSCEGIDSSLIVRAALLKAKDKGFTLVNVDCFVVLERPKLKPHIEAMKEKTASLLGIEKGDISIKCGTNEGLDALGEGRAVKAVAVCLMERKE